MINETIQNLKHFKQFSGRVFHGRGHHFPGYKQLNIEWYPPYLFVQNFSDTLDKMHEAELKQLFDSQTQIQGVIVQNRERQNKEGQNRAEPSTTILYQRNHAELPLILWARLDEELCCQITLGKNRNTGIFLDMRAGWHWVKKHSYNKVVLNLFSYTGVFSLFALEGGASRVINMDMAANVLKTAQRNHQKNDPFKGVSAFYKRDILKSKQQYSKLGPYDLIIIDPPPYQKHSFRGWKDYEKLLERCRSCLSPQGCLFVCLNTPHMTIQSFTEILEQKFPDATHLEVVDSAMEIKEIDHNKGLKTIAVYF